jgi:hypothetical protein
MPDEPPAGGVAAMPRRFLPLLSYERGCASLKGVASPEDIRISTDGRHVHHGTHGVGVVQLLRRN